MGQQRFTEAASGPGRRLLAVVALVCAVIAVVAPLGMVAAVLGALPDSFLGGLLFLWVLSLAVVFAVTRYLKQPIPGAPPSSHARDI